MEGEVLNSTASASDVIAFKFVQPI